MFDASAASSAFTATLTSVSGLVGDSLTAVLSIFAALLGLGFAISRLRRYIQRRKG